MDDGLAAANQALIKVSQENDPQPGYQGGRSLLIIRRAVEALLPSSFPVSAVLEVTIQIPDETNTQRQQIHRTINFRLNQGTTLIISGKQVQKTILFAQTFQSSKHYCTVDPSTDFIKAAYLKKIFGELQNELGESARVGFLLTRPLDYAGVLETPGSSSIEAE